MSDSSLIYIQNASKLLRYHYKLVLFPLIIAFTSSAFSILTEKYLAIYYLLSALITFVVIPVIYGRFNEIITRKKFVSWKYLFNKYFINYLLLVVIIALIISVPSFLFLLLMISFDAINFSKNSFVILLLLGHLIGLYSVPLLYFDNTLKQSLVLGFKCIFGNLKYNFPIILLLTLVSIISTFNAELDSNILNAMIYCIRWIALFLIDFVIFITITLIINDKIYTPIDNNEN